MSLLFRHSKSLNKDLIRLEEEIMRLSLRTNKVKGEIGISSGADNGEAEDSSVVLSPPTFNEYTEVLDTSLTTTYEFERDSLKVYLNGMRLTAGEDYEISGNKNISLYIPFDENDKIVVDYKIRS